MRIVSWNCGGRFREKFKTLLPLNADIYVIQECEDPNSCVNPAYHEFSKSAVWTGVNKNKGLGIFFKTGIHYIQNLWPDYGLRHFISVRIGSEFDLLGVWACKPYIEEYDIYQNINYAAYAENTIIIGDFNSNRIWDSQHGLRNHSAVVRALEAKNLCSAYHFTRNESQGKETEQTFYMHRHLNRGYHIDYCFLAPQRIAGFEILDPQKWLAHSDHMPMVLDII